MHVNSDSFWVSLYNGKCHKRCFVFLFFFQTNLCCISIFYFKPDAVILYIFVLGTHWCHMLFLHIIRKISKLSLKNESTMNTPYIFLLYKAIAEARNVSGLVLNSTPPKPVLTHFGCCDNSNHAVTTAALRLPAYCIQIHLCCSHCSAANFITWNSSRYFVAAAKHFQEQTQKLTDVRVSVAHHPPPHNKHSLAGNCFKFITKPQLHRREHILCQHLFGEPINYLWICYLIVFKSMGWGAKFQRSGREICNHTWPLWQMLPLVIVFWNCIALFQSDVSVPLTVTSLA